MKNQCHEPSSSLHLASSSIQHTGGYLPDDHSAVSISLKNVKRTQDRCCILDEVKRWLGSTEKLQGPALLAVGLTAAYL